MMRLLLIEDNERFAALLKRGLAAAGFVVDVLPTAAEARAALSANRFEIVVLDLGLPDADGLDILNEMRRERDATPVLILTARGSLKDRVNGLGSGADDYLVKPFALEELVARLRALLRRPGNLLGVSLELGNVTLDTVARQVLVGDEPIFFSAREIAVLEHLLRRSGRVVGKTSARKQSLRPVAGDRLECGRGLRAPVAQAFAEVGASVQIHTLRGVGYLIAEKKMKVVIRFRSVVSRIVALHLLAILGTSICMPIALYLMLHHAAARTAQPRLAGPGGRDPAATF